MFVCVCTEYKKYLHTHTYIIYIYFFNIYMYACMFIYTQIYTHTLCNRD